MYHLTPQLTDGVDYGDGTDPSNFKEYLMFGVIQLDKEFWPKYGKLYNLVRSIPGGREMGCFTNTCCARSLLPKHPFLTRRECSRCGVPQGSN